MEGLVEGSIKDVWVPLEKVKSGELRFQIEAVKMDDNEGSIGEGYRGNNEDYMSDNDDCPLAVKDGASDGEVVHVAVKLFRPH